MKILNNGDLESSVAAECQRTPWAVLTLKGESNDGQGEHRENRGQHVDGLEVGEEILNSGGLREAMAGRGCGTAKLMSSSKPANWTRLAGQ